MDIRDSLYIDGDWIKPTTDRMIEVISPVSEDTVARVPDGQSADIDAAVQAARRSFDTGVWRLRTATERSDLLDRAHALLQSRSEELAQLITKEMGSTITFSTLAQVPAPLAFLRYYSDLARDFQFDEIRTAGGTSIVTHEPVGVVGAIVPWNTPLLTTMLKVAPALAAGCSVVLKPAPASPLDAFVLAEALHEAGLPAGVFNVVPADGAGGEALVRHPGVDKIAFTGSTAAGKHIASLCGESVKRISLELGGKSAAIVLEDAPLEQVVAGLLSMSFTNSGQMCVAKSRILVPRSRSAEISTALADAVGSMPIGDPADPSVRIGPLVSEAQRARVEGYIDVGQKEGAKVLLGGGRPQGIQRGWYVEPTIFIGVHNQMRIAREEIFGPVVSILDYDTPEDAIAIANDSNFGLSGAVFTADVEKGIDVARQVRVGMYSVNGANQAAHTPVGGFKESGIGREVGPEAFQMYLEIKSIAIPPPEPSNQD